MNAEQGVRVAETNGGQAQGQDAEPEGNQSGLGAGPQDLTLEDHWMELNRQERALSSMKRMRNMYQNSLGGMGATFDRQCWIS